jgi:hypothetical protein
MVAVALRCGFLGTGFAIGRPLGVLPVGHVHAALGATISKARPAKPDNLFGAVARLR